MSGSQSRFLLPSIEAEQAVLGSLMMTAGTLELIASKDLRADDFSRPDHQLIFAAIARLQEQGTPYDTVTVFTALDSSGQADAAGGLKYLSRLVQDTPTSANIAAYAQTVLERSTRRSLHVAVTDSANVAELLANIDGLVARMRAAATGAQQPQAVSTLPLDPASTWAERPEPPPRDFVWGQLIPARRVTSLMGEGGLGKSIVALQIGVHVALNRPLYGLDVSGGAVLGIFCEDDQPELDRRIRAACAAENVELAALDRFVAVSREGEENLLCTFEHDQILFTAFYRQLEATISALSPVRLVIIDTVADVFGGDYMSTPHVRQFIKTGLTGLCVRYGCTVLVVAHPSASGVSSGEGDGFSRAWNNSVRSRLYLRRPVTTDKEEASDRRVLEVKKANYGPSGVAIPLIYHAGTFVPDHEPVDEGPKLTRAPRVNTALALAVMDYFRAHSAAGAVVTFGSLFETLQARGTLPKGDYQIVRKPLQRALKELADGHLLVPSKVPKGYRLPATAGDTGDTGGDKLGILGTLGTGDNGDTPIRGVSPRPQNLSPAGNGPREGACV